MVELKRRESGQGGFPGIPVVGDMMCIFMWGIFHVSVCKLGGGSAAAVMTDKMIAVKNGIVDGEEGGMGVDFPSYIDKQVTYICVDELHRRTLPPQQTKSQPDVTTHTHTHTHTHNAINTVPESSPIPSLPIPLPSRSLNS
jgi:hypothetical protein